MVQMNSPKSKALIGFLGCILLGLLFEYRLDSSMERPLYSITSPNQPYTVSSCTSEDEYQLTTFDRTGATVLTSQCLKISEPISNLINGTMSGVVALGSGSSGNGKNHLEVIADLVDDFLAPHFEWRIMGERFGLSQELLYDPAMHASTGPAVMARKTLLQTLHNDNSLSMAQEEEVLRQHGFDFILAQVTDEKMVALARALRNHQFPFLFDGAEANCAKLEEQTLGRSFVMYGGERDFLGAWTKQNVEHMITSLKANVPYIQGLPKVWGKTYHFENCTKSNGMECGFLPMYGGHCLSKRIQPTMDCLGDMTMGPYTTIALPKQGIPENVCAEGHKEEPYHDQTEAFKQWCSNCKYAGDVHTPSADEIANSTLPLSIRDITQINDKDMPLHKYYRSQKNESTVSDPTCIMELPPLQCHGRTCCYDEATIPVNVLGNITSERRPKDDFIKVALSAYLTRFNRASRFRIARLHKPRLDAMKAREIKWEEALSKGNCATLHIRRGDNIDRCANGEMRFCSMNLTLADYMNKASPMLAQLNSSKHVFVMTDDADVVSEDKLKPWQEQGYLFEIISGHNQYSKETYSDYDPFLESLYIAPACRAMVGHYISTVSKLVYDLMCARWGECPLHDMMHNP